MKALIACAYDMDNCCIELKFINGTLIAIDTMAVGKEIANNIHQWSESSWLIYNKPLEYAQLVLDGEVGQYVLDTPEHGLID